MAETVSPDRIATSVDVAANLAAVRARIDKAAAECGRDPADVHLVAVSKTHDANRITRALEVGHLLFGENRVQEALSKWPMLKQAFPAAKLHLIGHLQTNKAKEAVALFDVIETLDRPKLAKALAREMEKSGTRRVCYVQVNTGAEPQKGGIPPGEADDFIAACRNEFGLTVEGVMCIPPFDEEPAPHFALLKKIADRNGLAKVSMGMSGDFEIGVQFGATHVRVGTAIFGPRNQTGNHGATAA